MASLVALAMYTNVRVPYETLVEDWLRLLESEINFASRMKKPSAVMNATEDKLEEKFETKSCVSLSKFYFYVSKIFEWLHIVKNKPNFGQCPICLELMYSAARMTDCAHIFHAHCLRKSLEVVGDSCPMCRNPVLDSLNQDDEEDTPYSEMAYWQQHI